MLAIARVGSNPLGTYMATLVLRAEAFGRPFLSLTGVRGPASRAPQHIRIRLADSIIRPDRVFSRSTFRPYGVFHLGEAKILI